MAVMMPTLGGGGGTSKASTSKFFQTVSKPKQSSGIVAKSTPKKAAAPAKKAATPYKAPVYPAPVTKQTVSKSASKPAAKKVASTTTKKAASTPKVKTPSINDYLAGDSTYQATIAALAKQLSNYGTDYDTQVDQYGQNYNSSLKDLGYTPGTDGADGTWNFDDPLTASGRAYSNLVNDFAARGMLQGTDFNDANNQLTTSLNDQLSTLNQNRDQYLQNLGNQKTTYTDQNQTATQQAKAEAIARRAAKYGLT